MQTTFDTRFTTHFGLLLLLCAGTARAQCSPPLLDPSGPGQNAQTRLQNFHALLEGLYHPGGATRTATVDGEVHQVPPWFVSSTLCTELGSNGQSNLRGDDTFQPTSFADYLVSGDELSELMIVTSFGSNHDRMLHLHRTVQRMIAGSSWSGLPCITARVNASGITCRHGDTASDATARIALAYLQAARNPPFPSEWQDVYRQQGTALAYRHLEVEYVSFPVGQCPISGVTGQPICNWVGGGGTTSSFTLSDMKMWIGYHQDIVRMLFAAFEASRDTVFFDRAREVVDQWLVASEFTTAGPLRVGRKNFKWDTASTPVRPTPDPGDSFNWEPGNPAWDDSDAPRALWLGDVLRALRLSTNACAGELGPYAILREWVRRMQEADPSPPDQACIQWNVDGTPFGNCGHDYYYVGLGAGLHTDVSTAELQPKIDEALAQYGWTASPPTWNGTPCFGIYRGVRPVKALASALGLDTLAYGGGSCGLELHTSPPCRLLDTRDAGQPLAANERRSITISGLCAIPPAAKALALNVTVVEPSHAGHLTLFPGACPVPGTSMINFGPGQIRANNAVVKVSPGPPLSLGLHAVLAGNGSAHVILDVSGYFE